MAFVGSPSFLYQMRTRTIPTWGNIY